MYPRRLWTRWWAPLRKQNCTSESGGWWKTLCWSFKIVNRLPVFLSLMMAVLPAMGQNYQPQYHLRSEGGATIGDPSGNIKFQNTYHLWTWNDARSQDLVY